MTSVISSSPRADGSDGFRDLDHAVVVEIQSGHRAIGLGTLGFFLDGNGAPLSVHLDDAIAFGVLDPVAENGCAAFMRRSLRQKLRKAMPIKDVVSQDKADCIVPNELLADKKGLSEAARMGLRVRRKC